MQMAAITPVSLTPAPVTPASVADNLQSAQVYVAQGAGVQVDTDKVQQAVAGHPDVHVALVPDSAITDLPGGVDAFVEQVATDAGDSSAYIVASPHHLAIYDPNGGGQQVFQRMTDHGGGQTAELVYAIDHALDRPGAPSPLGAWLPLLLSAAAIAAGVAVWRRRSSRKDYKRYRADIQSEVDSLGEDLRIVDPGGNPDVVGPHAEGSALERALAVAWSRHAAAGGMIAGAHDTATVSRARTLIRQGRTALEHARRLRDGVPGESEVYASAGEAPGPLPSERLDEPPEGAVVPPARILSQYTVASYPGYGYGWYPGHGWGFFDYAGAFVAGMLAGELLDEAFVAPGGDDGSDPRHANYAGGAWRGAGVVGGWGIGAGGDAGGGGNVGGGGWGGSVGGGGWGGGGGGSSGGGGWG
ncbi:MAG: hypothetical protein ACJ74O_10380 [Frankiaceae bacterium]